MERLLKIVAITIGLILLPVIVVFVAISAVSLGDMLSLAKAD
jgi:hypothetical protein